MYRHPSISKVFLALSKVMVLALTVAICTIGWHCEAQAAQKKKKPAKKAGHSRDRGGEPAETKI